MQTNKLKFSIIIPVYNVEKYLLECYKSIVNQTYKSYEIIFVDDGSTDNSGIICDDLAQRNEQVVVIHQNNSGLSAARNAGLNIANGDYIFFVDSDDYISYPDALNNIANTLICNDYDMIMFEYAMVYEANGHIVERKANIDLLETDYTEILYQCTKRGVFPVSACNKVIKARIAKRHYFKEGFFSEDVEWFCRLSLDINRCAFIEPSPYMYRQRANSITTTSNIKKVFDLMQYVDEMPKYITENCESDKMIQCLLSGLAYEYVQCVASIPFYKYSPDYKLLYSKLKSHKSILKYDLNPKTRLSKYVILVLGPNLAGELLSLRIRKIKKIKG